MLGEVIATEIKKRTHVADCGHEYHEPWGGTGAAGYTTLPDGKKICYACADERQREELKTADTFVAYMDHDDHMKKIVTWTGGLLAKCDHVYLAKHRGFHGSYYLRWYFRAVDIHGARWYGTSPGPGMYARMRRVKGGR